MDQPREQTKNPALIKVTPSSLLKILIDVVKRLKLEDANAIKTPQNLYVIQFKSSNINQSFTKALEKIKAVSQLDLFTKNMARFNFEIIGNNLKQLIINMGWYEKIKVNQIGYIPEQPENNKRNFSISNLQEHTETPKRIKICNQTSSELNEFKLRYERIHFYPKLSCKTPSTFFSIDPQPKQYSELNQEVSSQVLQNIQQKKPSLNGLVLKNLREEISKRLDDDNFQCFLTADDATLRELSNFIVMGFKDSDDIELIVECALETVIYNITEHYINPYEKIC